MKPGPGTARPAIVVLVLLQGWITAPGNEYRRNGYLKGMGSIPAILLAQRIELNVYFGVKYRVRHTTVGTVYSDAFW